MVRPRLLTCSPNATGPGLSGVLAPLPSLQVSLSRSAAIRVNCLDTADADRRLDAVSRN
jgi:hypothetical protein